MTAPSPKLCMRDYQKRLRERCHLASCGRPFVDPQTNRIRELAKLLVIWQRAEWARKGRKAA